MISNHKNLILNVTTDCAPVCSPALNLNNLHKIENMSSLGRNQTTRSQKYLVWQRAGSNLTSSKLYKF